MPINGVETVAFGVKDVEQLVRYFDDFGLPSPHRHVRGADFTLPEGSKILVRYSDDQDLPPKSHRTCPTVTVTPSENAAMPTTTDGG